MCLIKKSRIPKVAWKPIKVYKVVLYFNKNLYTPFFCSPVKLNSTIKAQKKWYSNLNGFLYLEKEYILTEISKTLVSVKNI